MCPQPVFFAERYPLRPECSFHAQHLAGRGVLPVRSHMLLVTLALRASSTPEAVSSIMAIKHFVT